MELQKHFEGNWGYVSNPSGGFWGFWWKPDPEKLYYVQLEQEVLCVKLEVDDKQNGRELCKLESEKILKESEERNLHLKKPKKLGVGKTITLAKRDDYIQKDEKGIVDLRKTIEELRKWECKAD